MKIAIFALLLGVQLIAFQEPQGNASCGREPEPHPCSCARAMLCPMNGKPINPDEYRYDGRYERCKMDCKVNRCFCCKDCPTPKRK